MKKIILAAIVSLSFVPVAYAECIVEGTVQEVKSNDQVNTVKVLFDQPNTQSCNKRLLRTNRQGVMFKEEQQMIAMVPSGTRVQYAFENNKWNLKQVTFN